VLTVKPEVPYQRDISIFGESGGYTFAAPAFIKFGRSSSLPKGRRVQSNVIEIELLQQNEGSEGYGAALLFARSSTPRNCYTQAPDAEANAGSEIVERILPNPSQPRHERDGAFRTWPGVLDAGGRA
jgi:hypothetical protein